MLVLGISIGFFGEDSWWCGGEAVRRRAWGQEVRGSIPGRSRRVGAGAGELEMEPETELERV